MNDVTCLPEGPPPRRDAFPAVTSHTGGRGLQEGPMLRGMLVLAAAVALSPVTAAAQDYDPNLLGTFSIIARDPATGELGMGVQSKAFAAGNRVAGAKGGVGVIAHQAVSNPLYS